MNSTYNATLTRSSLEIISLSVTLAIIIALSLCGNFLLILAFIRNERLRASFANKLIMSLAMADFLTAAFPLTYQLATVINVDIIKNGGFLCTVGGLASYSFFFTSVFTLVMLSVDRFIALGFPLRYKQLMKHKVQVFMILHPWLHGVLFFAFCAGLTYVKYAPKTFDCGLSWKTRSVAFTLTILIIHIGIPLFLLIILNTWTLLLVRAQNKKILNYGLKEINKDTSTVRKAYNRRANIECRLARVSTVIIFVFLACWTPYVVTRTFVFFGVSLSSGIMSGAAWSVHASSFVNPMIYSSLRADLRRSMFGVFRCCNFRVSRVAMITEVKLVTAGSTGDGVTSSNATKQNSSHNIDDIPNS